MSLNAISEGLFGILGAWIATTKGRSGCGWFLLCSILGPIGLILAATFTMATQNAIVKLVSTALPLWRLFTPRSLILVPLLVVLILITYLPALTLWLPDLVLGPDTAVIYN